MKITLEINEVDLAKNEKILELFDSFNSRCMSDLTKSQRDEVLTVIADLQVRELFKICKNLKVSHLAH